MGNTISEKNIVIIGDDAAGKTCLAQRLANNAYYDNTIPTMLHDVFTFTYANFQIQLFDVGAREFDTQPIQTKYLYLNAHLIVYVVDAADKDRMNDFKARLHKELGREETKSLPILFVANKQDLPHAASPDTITSLLQLHQVTQKWSIAAVSVKDGTGLDTMLQQMATLLNA